MRPNPPIKGHKLLHEGHSVKCLNPVTENYDRWEEGCECGEKPVPPANSINEMKRWHREHKHQLRLDVVRNARTAGR